MGLSSSKHNAAASSSSSSSVVGRTRSYRSRVFQSSCLRSHRRSDNAQPQVSDYHTEGNALHGSCANENKSVSNAGNGEFYRKVKVQQPDGIACVTSEIEHDEWDQMRGGCMSSQAFSSRALNQSNHFLSRLNIFPGNVSFRLRRANSLGSTRPYFASSTRFVMSNNECEPSPSGNVIDRNDSAHHNLSPTCFTTQSPRSEHVDFSTYNLREMTSARGVLRDRVDSGVDCDGNAGYSNHPHNEDSESRLANRRIAAGETVERNARFSRTLSVGRLRDRVLRRTHQFPDIVSSPLQQDGDVGRS